MTDWIKTADNKIESDDGEVTITMVEPVRYSIQKKNPPYYSTTASTLRDAMTLGERILSTEGFSSMEYFRIECEMQGVYAESWRAGHMESSENQGTKQHETKPKEG